MRTLLLIAALALAPAAHADVSDSGSLSIGAYGVVAGSMTASSYYGDGSHLTGVSGSLPYFFVINSTDATTTWAIVIDTDGTLRTNFMTFASTAATSIPIEATDGGNWTITVDDDGTLRTNR